MFDKSCTPPLDHFNFVDVYPFVWDPDAAGEFNCWPNHRCVCCFLDAIFKFLLKNPMVLFALVVTEVICWPQSKVLLVISYTSKIFGRADMWKKMVISIETVIMIN